MRIGCTGTDPILTRRKGFLRGYPEYVGRADADDEIGLLFVGVPVGERFETASAALRKGVNVSLEWPPTASVHECARLVRLAEEAGLETAVSRPLRACVLESEDSWRARLVSIETSGVSHLTAALADVIDLSFALVGSGSVRRVEAEAERDEARRPTAVAMSMRFHNGAYVQSLVRSGGSDGGFRVYAAGGRQEMERVLQIDDELLEKETHAVVGAIRDQKPVPVSALEALQTLRTVERVMDLLR